MLHRATLLLAATLSPAAYPPPVRLTVASRICITAAQTLPWFTLLAGLLSLVLVHIVVVTAQSYGLSEFALGTVIRVLVVELLPLSAALFVALRGGLAEDAGDAERSNAHRESAADAAPPSPLPDVVASAVAVVALAALSGGIALAVAYLEVYGFTPWGLAAFTRTVGQVFDPIVLMSLGLKTALFAAAVAVIPPACAGASRHVQTATGEVALLGTIRLLAVLVAVETLSLVAEFF